jgi:hypothetical protein
MTGVMGTCNWRATDALGASRWWIVPASTVDSTLIAGPKHLDAANVMGISNWRVTDAMGTSSSWRAADVMGVAPVTYAFASSGMSPI